MRIATSQLYNRPASLMSQLTAEADRIQTQIATGKRIQTASDDPAAFLRLAGMQQQTADDGAWSANIGMAQGLPQHRQQEFVDRCPLGRLGTPDEVAELAAFMVSGENAFMTGAKLVVDGGLRWTPTTTSSRAASTSTASSSTR